MKYVIKNCPKLTGYKVDVKPVASKEKPATDVVSTSSANIILDDDFFDDIDE